MSTGVSPPKSHAMNTKWRARNMQGGALNSTNATSLRHIRATQPTRRAIPKHLCIHHDQMDIRGPLTRSIGANGFKETERASQHAGRIAGMAVATTPTEAWAKTADPGATSPHGAVPVNWGGHEQTSSRTQRYHPFPPPTLLARAVSNLSLLWLFLRYPVGPPRLPLSDSPTSLPVWTHRVRVAARPMTRSQLRNRVATPGCGPPP